MSVLSTINGIDVVLLLAALGFLYLWLMERSYTRDLEGVLEDNEAGLEILEYAEQDVRVLCGVSTHWETVQGFRGNGQPILETIQRINPPTTGEEICRLDVGHTGPHMSTSAVWT